MNKVPKAKSIGADIKAPKDSCDDTSCPFHGDITVRGKTFVGTVIESKMQKTATVEWDRSKLIKKYERHEKRTTKVKAHNPDCLKAKKGDKVRIMECRPLSKTKHFIIVEKLGYDQDKMLKDEAIQEDLEKVKESRKKENASDKVEDN